MITKDEIEQRRSPRELSEFVSRKRSEIEANNEERHRAMLKTGIYKQFVEELMSLARCAETIYPENVTIQPALGNQGYDALVFNASGINIEKIEIAIPRRGEEEAVDASLLVNRGYGEIQVFESGEQLGNLIPLLLKVAKNKSLKDYSDCTLLFVINFAPPRENERPVLLDLATTALQALQQICFRVKRVVLVIEPLKFVKVVQDVSSSAAIREYETASSPG